MWLDWRENLVGVVDCCLFLGEKFFVVFWVKGVFVGEVVVFWVD